jgi:hypothetical protein
MPPCSPMKIQFSAPPFSGLKNNPSKNQEWRRKQENIASRLFLACLVLQRWQWGDRSQLLRVFIFIVRFRCQATTIFLTIFFIFFNYWIFTIYSRYIKRVISKRDGCEYLKQVPSIDGSLELI